MRQDLANLFLRNISGFLYSEVVLMELLAALRNLSKSTPKIAYIQKHSVNVLIKLAKLPPNEKIQQIAI
jgi:hypothetical protein